MGIQPNARKEARENELSIKIPTVINNILFPFRKNMPVRITLCMVSFYLEISSIIIYFLAFLRKGNVNWKDINGKWFMLLCTLILAAAVIDCIKETLYEKENRNLGHNLLAGAGCVIILLITIAWILFMIYLMA